MRYAAEASDFERTASRPTQALATEWSVSQQGKLEHKVYNVPKAVDEWVAGLKLQTMGVSIDTLTDEQKKYLSSWEMGT